MTEPGNRAFRTTGAPVVVLDLCLGAPVDWHPRRNIGGSFSFGQREALTVPYREHIASKHGFHSVAELMLASEAIPMQPGDVVQRYLARHPDGQTFVWEDSAEMPADDDPLGT